MAGNLRPSGRPPTPVPTTTYMYATRQQRHRLPMFAICLPDRGRQVDHGTAAVTCQC